MLRTSDGRVFSPKWGICSTRCKDPEASSKKWKECKLEGLENARYTIAIANSTCTGIAQVCAYHQPAIEQGGIPRLYLFLMIYGLLMDSGWRTVLLFNCVPEAEPRRLQWRVPLLVTQSWLKSVGYTTDQNDMNMGKEIVGAHNQDGRIGVREATQNVLYTWMKLSKNKGINTFLKFEF